MPFVCKSGTIAIHKGVSFPRAKSGGYAVALRQCLPLLSTLYMEVPDHVGNWTGSEVAAHFLVCFVCPSL